jgi:4-hydroxy-3-polyprenylbenzoate decarboxylase
MGYRNLRQCVEDLAANGHLVRCTDEVDAHLEAAEIQRRVFLADGPAVLFENVQGCSFPMVSNLFGSLPRAHFIFRDTLEWVQRLVELKTDSNAFWKKPLRYWKAPWIATRMRPRRCRSGPVLACQTTVDQLPQLRSWPDDGGAFITLPQVYTEHADEPGMQRSNLGMYRIQLSGGQYAVNEEIGLHYQLHRGIGVHHAAAIRNQSPFHVNVFVGGSPAMNLAAVMPLPENLSELLFAGALGNRRTRMVVGASPLPIYAEADFCITGQVDPDRMLPEGPFGDHLGYYSLAHDFPVLKVEKVFHRRDAIWPFTVVGRPPQEDTSFGKLIHEITGAAIPQLIAGLHAVHAVDASGVHPLLLAIGSERYVPYESNAEPRELLTQANAILGQGQLSLAKYLWIVNHQDNPQLDIHQVDKFLQHALERVDWTRDVHFQTQTTIDTLDYSGHGLNRGSKVVIAATGPPRRSLPDELPADLVLPPGFQDPRICLPGVLAIKGPACQPSPGTNDHTVETFCQAFHPAQSINQFPLVIIVDDSQFVTESFRNFLWTVFTRSNPADDIHGIGASTIAKHWQCQGSLVIDARIKPHHAPPLIEDPDVTRKIDALAARGGPLAPYL